jgi:omega-amidase
VVVCYTVGMRIVAVQYDIVWEDNAANHELVAGLLASVAFGGDELIVLPEMFDTGFSLDLERTAEEEGGASHRFLAGLAKGRGGHVLAGLTVRRADGRVENQAVGFGPDGSVVARYAKIHPFTPGGETEVISAGDSVVTFGVGDFQVAPFVCYDLRFPEIYRIATGRGAHLLVTIANWPGVRASHWRSLLAARAIENQAFVLGVNRCGVDPNHGYAGESVLFDPLGDVVGRAEASECVLVREIEVKEVVAWRREFPVQDDSRPHLYSNQKRKSL